MRSRIAPWAPLFAFLLLLAACGGGEEPAQAQDIEEASGAAEETSTAAEGAGTAAETASSGEVEAIQVIGQGQEVDVTAHLVEGKTTVVDFYSDYCPPCRRIAPYLKKLHAKGGDVAVLKVDINRPGHKGIDWKSPVAQQYGLRSIPHFQIYDAQGELTAEGQDAYQKLIALLQEAGVEG